MSDIVKRLRSPEFADVAEKYLMAKAAQEIERLRDIERGAKQVIEDMEREIEWLRAVLQRLVTDYQDVPDPTDADGQAVFEDARRALEGGK